MFCLINNDAHNKLLELFLVDWPPHDDQNYPSPIPYNSKTP